MTHLSVSTVVWEATKLDTFITIILLYRISTYYNRIRRHPMSQQQTAVEDVLTSLASSVQTEDDSAFFINVDLLRRRLKFPEVHVFQTTGEAELPSLRDSEHPISPSLLFSPVASSGRIQSRENPFRSAQRHVLCQPSDCHRARHRPRHWPPLRPPRSHSTP